MSEDQTAIDDKKHIVSIRLNNADRIGVRSTAARLFVRESELYRFAVCHLLHRLHQLHDDTCIGCDLIPLFLEFRDELNTHLKLKKHQHFKIFNGKNTLQDKFVAMSDIELLLLPRHAVRQRLQLIPEAIGAKCPDTESWLKQYLFSKYRICADLSSLPYDEL